MAVHFYHVYVPHTHTASFQRRHKYNVPVQMCAHPELNQYVRNMLGSIRPLLEMGAVEKVVLAIEDKVHITPALLCKSHMMVT